MRTLFSLLILLVGLIVVMPSSPIQASMPNQNSFMADVGNVAPEPMIQEEGGVPVNPEQTNIGQETTSNFILDNWGALILGLLGFIDLIARLTPTEKDNSIVNFLLSLFNAIIPNFKKGGGSFKLLSK